ncbi:hypothetical protein [Symbioplanes lichenis]|uniref:hypothetical protein n=1 Tax=Symbioplanes lichenis TaxID=1629072 RepID=UPI002738B1A4|nr:hypothetical protein [Actinoplanes lichenis]
MSLDELFTAEGDERPAESGEKRRSRFGWIVRTVLLVGGATAITLALLNSRGIKVSVLLVVTAFLALRLMMWAVSQVAPPPAPRRSAPARSSDAQRGDTLQQAVRRWERQLDWSKDDGERFSRIVLPALVELTDERLRLRHGVTRASDPQRAREIMGEPLWQLLAGSERRLPKPREMASYVDALERI